MALEIAFYLTGIACAYSYFLYPLLLRLVPARRSLEHAPLDDDRLPSMSLIITAHNEESRITEKIDNSLEIDYPSDRLEIIVASDCSSDATDDIVNGYADRGVRLVRATERKGKEHAQLCAIEQASGEVLVFSDVATRIPPEALRLLAVKFADEEIGAVSSEDRFVSNDGSIVGEGAYVKYEMWLRRLESTRAGLIGLSGSFFAARREVCEQWDIYCPSDFNTALNCAQSDVIAITCPEVLGIYKDVKDPALEYRRKLRTVIRGLTAIARHPEVLNPFRFGLFSLQVWSHKIMRWGVPWFMLIFALLTLALVGCSLIAELALLGQMLFYAIAITGWLVPTSRDNTLIRLVYFFVSTNLALAHATVQFIGGQRMTVWTPSKR